MTTTRVVLNVLFVAAIVASLAGAAFFLVRDTGSNGVTVTLPTPAATETGVIKVHVTGAVNAPGVYTLGVGARVEDAIAAAGGAATAADLDAVNLALKVRDEDKVTIPRAGVPGTGAPQAIVTGGTGHSAIDLNEADVDTLTSLPGIGAVKAEAIVAHRENNGPFTRIEDLLLVSGIGAATLEAVRDLVVVR